MLETWKNLLDKGRYGFAMLMDLSKAFDTIHHDLMTAKLRECGFFSHDVLHYMRNHLTNRKQRFGVNSNFSTSESIARVPQCSILGPLLFNVFANDLFLFVLNSYYLQ